MLIQAQKLIQLIEYNPKSDFGGEHCHSHTVKNKPITARPFHPLKKEILWGNLHSCGFNTRRQKKTYCQRNKTTAKATSIKDPIPPFPQEQETVRTTFPNRKHKRKKNNVCTKELLKLFSLIPSSKYVVNQPQITNFLATRSKFLLVLLFYPMLSSKALYTTGKNTSTL